MRARRIWQLALVATLLSGCVRPVVVPMKQRDCGPYYFVEVEFNGAITDFMVDTGTSFPIVSDSFVTAESFEVTDSIESVLVVSPSDITNSSAPTTFPILRSTSFGIGNAVAEDGLNFAVVDTDAVVSITCGAVDGFIGGGVLNSAPYSIDFPGRVLTLGATNPHSIPAFPLSMVKNLLFVDAFIGPNKVSFLIDSGSLQTRISAATASQVLRADAVINAGPVKRIDIFGVKDQPMSAATIDSFRIGDFVVRDLPVLIGEDNVVGIDVLSQGVLTIDPNAKTYSFR